MIDVNEVLKAAGYRIRDKHALSHFLANNEVYYNADRVVARKLGPSECGGFMVLERIGGGLIVEGDFHQRWARVVANG